MPKYCLNIDVLRPVLVSNFASPLVESGRRRRGFRPRVGSVCSVCSIMSRLPNLVACSHVPAHPTNTHTRRETVRWVGICFEIRDDGSLSAKSFRMEAQDPEKAPSTKLARTAPEVGPFVLRSLLADLPLSAEGDGNDIEINCVEFLGMCDRTPLLGIMFMFSPLQKTTTDNAQTSTSTLGHPLPKSSTFSKFLQTRKTHLQSPPIF
jgi:hypothetical protein